MILIDLVELLHPLHARREEARIAHLGVDRVARRRDRDVAGELHRWLARSASACSSAAMRSGASRGVRWRAPARPVKVEPLIARCMACAIRTGVPESSSPTVMARGT